MRRSMRRFYQLGPPRHRRYLFVGLVCLIWPPDAWPQSRIQFHDLTAQTAIAFRHHDGSRGNYYIVEAMSAGLALFDYDGDGDCDIYFLNGQRQDRGDSVELSRNALYRNDGNWSFTDVTEQAGVGDTGHGLGVTVGDYDNDGDPDLYVTNFGPNVLYRNNADGTFSDVTDEAQVANGHRVGAGASFLDIDGDGDLDLFVANYVKFELGSHVPRTKQGYPIYGSPADYEPESDTLFRNESDGTFRDISLTSGIATPRGTGMGVVCADYDDDGDTDIFVANDGMRNFLYRNDGRGTFTEAGLLSGFAYDMAGKVHASMGVDCADLDNDGRLDFHVTSFQGELATLYRNLGNGLLEDVTISVGAAAGTRAPVTWGNGLVDFDNDGDRDIFIACGHLYDQLDQFDRSTTYLTPNLILENLDGDHFRDVSAEAGDGMQAKSSSRGAAFDDLDGDGDVDIVVLNSRAQPTILRNDTPRENHWIRVTLRGTSSNRDAVGARVEVIAGDLTMVDEVHSGRGYQSHFGTCLHFGLGSNRRVDRIRIRWPDGEYQTLENLEVDRVLTVTEPSRVGRP